MDTESNDMVDTTINHDRQKYPFCLVWTPIPVITWFLPFVGHMGIGTSSGVIRDFAGPFHVGTGNMAFGKPTKYLQFDPALAVDGAEGWDKAINEASEVYKNRNHNLFFDNCHSHVGMALNKMHYKNTRWNMIKLAFLLFICAKYSNLGGVLRTWGPFILLLSMGCILVFSFQT